MRTDHDLELWLRRELAQHESRQPPAPDLAEESVAGARRVRRRRALLTGTASLAAAAVVVAVAVTATGDVRPGRTDPPPATQEPTTPVEADVLLAGVWAGSLPMGDPPEAPYATETHLYLPSGQVVELEDDAVIIGETVAGTVLLVERFRGDLFDSWYVLVSPDGQVSNLDSGRITGDRVQEAAVSPDGRYFVDGNIFDMTTGEIVGSLPDAADTVFAWTPAGIVYGVYGAGQGTYVWSPGGSSPAKLGGWPGGYPNGTDIGLAKRGSCVAVVRLAGDGSESELSRHCGISPNAAISPAGTWLVTPELVAIETATGKDRPVAGRQVRDFGFAYHAHWLSEDEVLLSVPAGGFQPDGGSYPSDSALIVRCDLAAATCERATEAYVGGQVLGLP